ncbi:MAG: hypothetical protein FJ267_12135 [Planctomycetes bacterium]|nr:hypothetical protein [Planctomycetota bacterium]
MNSAQGKRLSCESALRILAEFRRDNEIIVTNQMSARLWPEYSQHALDFVYLSSTMGGAIPLGLGLALARPDHEVTVVSGDGSLLMNLGCLITVVASQATNFSIVLLDNGLYEVTGGQKTAGHVAACDYAAMASAAMFSSVHKISNIDDFGNSLRQRSSLPGPHFYTLSVSQVATTTRRHTSAKVDKELARFRSLFSGSSQ